MVTASTPGTVRSRSTSARCDCRPRASSYPARPGSTSTSNPPSRRNPGSAVAAESALIRNSPPDASRRSESATWPITRALPILTPPAAGLPRRDVPLEVRRGRATGQRPGRPGAEDQRGDQTEPHGADENSPVETERRAGSRRRGARDAATPAARSVAHVDSNSPTAAPANARSNPSVTSCRVRRDLPPPSDDLIASSCRRCGRAPAADRRG